MRYTTFFHLKDKKSIIILRLLPSSWIDQKTSPVPTNTANALATANFLLYPPNTASQHPQPTTLLLGACRWRSTTGFSTFVVSQVPTHLIPTKAPPSASQIKDDQGKLLPPPHQRLHRGSVTTLAKPGAACRRRRCCLSAYRPLLPLPVSLLLLGTHVIYPPCSVAPPACTHSSSLPCPVSPAPPSSCLSNHSPSLSHERLELPRRPMRRPAPRPTDLAGRPAGAPFAGAERRRRPR
ncbi:hypothetical protein ACQJBY_038604 [Aegilops geniculata]